MRIRVSCCKKTTVPHVTGSARTLSANRLTSMILTLGGILSKRIHCSAKLKYVRSIFENFPDILIGATKNQSLSRKFWRFMGSFCWIMWMWIVNTRVYHKDECPYRMSTCPPTQLWSCSVWPADVTPGRSWSGRFWSKRFSSVKFSILFWTGSLLSRHSSCRNPTPS